VKTSLKSKLSLDWTGGGDGVKYERPATILELLAPKGLGSVDKYGRPRISALGAPIGSVAGECERPCMLITLFASIEGVVCGHEMPCTLLALGNKTGRPYVLLTLLGLDFGDLLASSVRDQLSSNGGDGVGEYVRPCALFALLGLSVGDDSRDWSVEEAIVKSSSGEEVLREERCMVRALSWSGLLRYKHALFCSFFCNAEFLSTL
jgi:hypothetical protein